LDLGTEYTRHGAFIESREEMKQKFKEKYHPESYKYRLLDKLHSIRHGSMSVQNYTIEFHD